VMSGLVMDMVKITTLAMVLTLIIMTFSCNMEIMNVKLMKKQVHGSAQDSMTKITVNSTALGMIITGLALVMSGLAMEMKITIIALVLMMTTITMMVMVTVLLNSFKIMLNILALWMNMVPGLAMTYMTRPTVTSGALDKIMTGHAMVMIGGALDTAKMTTLAMVLKMIMVLFSTCKDMKIRLVSIMIQIYGVMITGCALDSMMKFMETSTVPAMMITGSAMVKTGHAMDMMMVSTNAMVFTITMVLLWIMILKTGMRRMRKT